MTTSEFQKDSYQSTLEEIDRGIRLMHSSIGLTNSDREYLEDRGLCAEEIEVGLYFSLQPQQPLPPGMPIQFPGSTYYGESLTNKYRGIAQILFNPDRLAIGFQIMNLDPRAESECVWASNKINSAKLDGELPLTYIKPPKELVRRKYPGICGAGLQPHIAAFALGQTMIGSPEGRHAYSPKSGETSRTPHTLLMNSGSESGISPRLYQT